MWHDLHDIPITVLRVFSVYGPWGRPDMAPQIFAESVMNGEALSVTQDRKRDFTYIDDVVDGILLALEKQFDFEVINIGRGESVELTDFISSLEKAAGKKAKIETRPAPPGEMRVTYANIDKAKRLLGYEPKISIDEGAKKLVEWMKTNKSSTL
jgi:UDP-glucuronate 4-epimerase